MHNLGKEDTSRLFTFLNLKETADEPQTIVYGLPYEKDTGLRPGSRYAPNAIRRSRKIDFKRISPKYGDVVIDGGDLMMGKNNEIEGYRTPDGLVNVQSPGFVVGGCRSITNSRLMSLKLAGKKVALVSLSAHEILIDEEYFDTKHSICFGVRDWAYPNNCKCRILRAEEMHEMGVVGYTEIMKNIVGNTDVYVSVSADFLDPAYMPGAQEPVCGGFSIRETLKFIRKGFAGLKIIGGDIVGIVPAYDCAELTIINGEYILNELLFAFFN